MVKKPQFVAYLRVSTAKQGITGLGISAQRQTVQSFERGRILTPKSRILKARHKLNDETRKDWFAQGVANVIERLNITRPAA